MKLSIDTNAGVAYILLSDEPVVSTREINDWIYVDMDEYNRACGIEVLDLGQPLPLALIGKRCHIDSDVIDQLASLRISETSVRQYQGRDTTLGRAHPPVLTSI